MKCKKTLAVLLMALILCFACSATAFAATTNGLEVTAEITTANGDTAYIAKVGDTAAYIEVLSGGNIWPMDTANPFAATVCTVVDGSGNELGTLESADGVIDWGIYPDAAEIVCSTDFTGDVYTVVIADLGAASGGDSAGAEAQVMEITTANSDTAYITPLGASKVYVEVLSGGNIWPLDTANPFAATVCTVVDGSGNELGTLESSEGTIDWSAYPDAAKIVCSTDFTGDVYEIDVAAVAAFGTSDAPAPAPSQPSGGQASGGAVNSPLFGKVVSVINVASYVVMVLWVVILVTTITRCYKDGIFGAKRRAKNCPVNGVWDLSVTTPHGANEGVIEFRYDGNVLHGTLNDKFNTDSMAYEGKMIGSDAFECLIKIDIGMGSAAEFRMQGKAEGDKLVGEMVLTAMESIKSTFTAVRKG